MKILACRWEPYILGALLDEQAEIALLFDEYEATHFEMDPVLLDRMTHVFRVASYDDMHGLGQVATELKLRDWLPDKVLSLSEFSQFGAAYLASALGVEQPTLGTALLARDKRAMKSAIAARGVDCANFVSLRTSETSQAVTAMQTRIGFPAVVKPATGFGTLGTQWIHSARDLRNLLAEQGGDGFDHFLIAEEPVSGDEYHVDAVWVRGACKVLGVSRYLKPRIDIKTAGRDNGSVLLPPHDWPELYGDVAELHAEVNAALGISDGITHMELFKRPGSRQLCFSEIATRYGGGGITQTFRAWGEDLRLTWIKSLFSPDRDSPYSVAARARYAGWINLAPEEAGRITREPSDAEIAAFPYVLDTIRVHGTGDEFGDPHPSAWCLLLIVAADTLDQFTQRCAELEAALGASFQVAKP